MSPIRKKSRVFSLTSPLWMYVQLLALMSFTGLAVMPWAARIAGPLSVRKHGKPENLPFQQGTLAALDGMLSGGSPATGEVFHSEPYTYASRSALYVWLLR